MEKELVSLNKGGGGTLLYNDNFYFIFKKIIEHGVRQDSEARTNSISLYMDLKLV